MKRSRILYFHEETNPGKILALEALSTEYRRYLQTCIDLMIRHQRVKIALGEHSRFFPVEKVLCAAAVQTCQAHAVEIVFAWSASLYTTKMKGVIKRLFKAGAIDEATRIALFTVGKYSVSFPSEAIPQEMLDLYWALVLEESNTPTISNHIGIRTTISTSNVKVVEKDLSSWWLGLATLVRRKTIKIPLKANPFIKSPDDVVNGCLVRKDWRGRWRVEVLERKVSVEPKFDPKAPKIGVDVGLNVIAATSDGELFGSAVKPKFDALYAKIKALRANRQRQGFKENSPKLDVLEDRLSGLIKTATGTVANKLVKAHPGTTFVIEDLSLESCKGQKRFAYRALHKSLSTKAPILVVNPAYTSQQCPSCGHVSRNNRKGTKFHCRGCGRTSHADVVGGINLLGRSEDKQIGLDDHQFRVKSLLAERYRLRRDSSSGESAINEFEASNRRLTVGALSKDESSIASNAEGYAGQPE